MVCCEPMQFVAVPRCGHTDVCSTCVARLRMVVGSVECAMCRAPSEHVLVTRFSGSFTAHWQEEAVLRAERDTQFYEPMGAYFDASAAEHCAEIRSKSLLRCPLNTSGASQQTAGGGKGKGTHRCTKGPFTRIEDFRNHLRAHKLSLCKLCCEGRKCFQSEQRIYTKAELDSHLKHGETTEEDGKIFHPECKFCVQRFYDDNALYTHMTREHFTCHLCSRQNPEAQHRYYPTYAALEAHFRDQHCLCEDPACLEKKFVVFNNEHELKRHYAAEHGGDMSSQQRRRDANTAPDIAQAFFFQPSRRRGGGDAPSRGGGGGGGRSTVHIEDDGPVRDDSARQVGFGSSDGGHPAGPIFSESDPSLAAANGGSDRSGGPRSAGWVAAQGANAQRPDLSDGNLFPSLPSAPPRRRGRQGGWGGAVAQRMANANVIPLGDRPAMQAPTRGGPRPRSAQQQQNPFASRPAQQTAAAAARVGGGPAVNPFASGPTSTPAQAAGATGARTRPAAPAADTRSLKERGAALAARLKKEVGSNEEAMGAVKSGLRSFQKGEMDARALVEQLAALRLAHIVPDIAAVCPVEDKRDELNSAHTAYDLQQRQAQQQSAPQVGGAGGGRWSVAGGGGGRQGAPVARAPAGSIASRLARAHARDEQAREEAERAAADARTGWDCSACTLNNPSWRSECAACGKGRFIETLAQTTNRLTGAPRAGAGGRGRSDARNGWARLQ